MGTNGSIILNTTSAVHGCRTVRNGCRVPQHNFITQEVLQFSALNFISFFFTISFFRAFSSRYIKNSAFKLFNLMWISFQAISLLPFSISFRQKPGPLASSFFNFVSPETEFSFILSLRHAFTTLYLSVFIFVYTVFTVICGIETNPEEKYIVQHIVGKLMTQGRQ